MISGCVTDSSCRAGQGRHTASKPDATKPENSSRSSRRAKARSPSAEMSSTTTRLPALLSSTRRIGTTFRRTKTRTTRARRPKPACSTWRISNPIKRRAASRHFSLQRRPGSSTVWLHMGAFGPKRVVTADDSHTPAAPYPVVNNDYSLLDVSDLVFVDAPGTGFSRISGKDREKAFYGVDQDAQAFADFIVQFLGKYGRWNSPKYMFGESYGTTRSAVLANVLETHRVVDFNGVILVVANIELRFKRRRSAFNPGVELPYQLALPTYAASAWYHHKLPDTHQELAPLVAEVEHFAMNDYAQALAAGSTLPPEQRKAIAAKAASIHGPPGGIHRESGSAHQRRRIRKDTSGRHGYDDRPARHALFRAHVGSAQQRGGIRSSIGGDRIGLRFRFQRLRAQRIEVWREQDFQAGNRDLEVVEFSASASGIAAPLPWRRT